MMLRTILATTALATVLSVPVSAADNQPVQMDPAAKVEVQENTNLYLFDMNTLAEQSARGYLASNLIGKYVYTSNAEDADSVGDINDIVIGEDGQIRAVIVGVGGFLGIGEKDVAVDFDRLAMVAVDDDELRVTSDVSKEELEAAQEYERPDYIPDWMTSSNVRNEMDKVADATKQTYETVRDEAKTAWDNTTAKMADGTWMEGKTQVETGTISAETLIGATVYNNANEDIGEVSEVLLTADGEIDAAVLDVGGFLGIGEKPVAVSFTELTIYKDEDGELYVSTPFTRAELEQGAAYDAETYKSDRDAMVIGS
ncbi:PRC-barrel domain-containing protein [Roseibium sp.]|uniref:PRC-barrel domain-containing protein n=1 Tax=Roseibium sp. TaxID=1936156 RepID=UPI003A974655